MRLPNAFRGNLKSIKELESVDAETPLAFYKDGSLRSGYHSTAISDRYDFDSRSVSSWAYEDEFDRQASNAVQDSFRVIEDVLYDDANEDGGKITDALRNECEEWRFMFPHLRVKGHQLLPANDAGVQVLQL